MQFKKISSFFEHAVLLIKKINELQQSPQDIYRLVEIKKTNKDRYLIGMQIIGKSIVIECTPQEIIANDCILEGFSKKDIRILLYLAGVKSTKPKYQISQQKFCDKHNKMLFAVKNMDNDEIICITAAQLIADKNFINNLSIEDVCCLSYMAGYEHAIC